jgi:hypothetical protein
MRLRRAFSSLSASLQHTIPAPQSVHPLAAGKDLDRKELTEGFASCMADAKGGDGEAAA